MPTQTTTSTTSVNIAPKNMVVAYVLWFFLGGLGIHRFYLGKTGTAVTQLIFTILGAITAAFVVGIFLLIAVGIWLIVDIFLIPGMVRSAGGSSALYTTTQTTIVHSDDSDEE